uniref:Uncharacterized protein n=1 Tax=Magallana gigas TaxID=29159 RepID=K1Q8L6_MAGGI
MADTSHRRTCVIAVDGSKYANDAVTSTSGNTPHKLLRKPAKQVRRESQSKHSNIENGTTQ